MAGISHSSFEIDISFKHLYDILVYKPFGLFYCCITLCERGDDGEINSNGMCNGMKYNTSVITANLNCCITFLANGLFIYLFHHRTYVVQSLQRKNTFIYKHKREREKKG